ncbi:olfactory receptor 11L1-like [Aquarana catesbeiana]|uniref:olfactory receptor 11L1-like n=1 Tax=Aquarana catesbeiana TaxID=8400 RepID=UPI003CC9E70D
MGINNMTVATVIHLLGFQIPENIRFLVFFLFLMIYCVTICGNLLIITLVSYGKALHSPMYFFLAQLAVSDILLATDVLPNTLHVAFVESTMIVSISDCIAQFYFFAATETLECLLLTVMSYDRYLAICKPLHYAMLMNHKVCWRITLISWTLGFVSEFIHTLTISKLQFCGSNIIDHFFCDLDPILQLSCSDTTTAQLEATALSVIFAIIPFFAIIVSYICIIVTILEIPSIVGRQKVFSTCSSHLTVVSIFYGTIVCVYLVPSRGQSLNISKFLSLLYTVVTPLLNPIIYSLRNKDLKKVAGEIIRKFLYLRLNNH